MKGTSKAAVLFSFAIALAAMQFWGTEALASSSYFTSAGCSGCHSAPVAATCNGCHAHGTHPTSAKSTINVAGATNKASYAPGETVTVTITGGYRTGWFRAVLYDQNMVELTRSTGNDSGMGSSAIYPAVLTAPAPVAPGTYTWKVAWYGNQYDKSSPVFGAGWIPDPTNPNHGSEIVSANSFTVTAPADTTAPVVSAFTLPATATSLTVPVNTLNATDNVGVTGYLITTSATAPAAGATGWTAAAPASVTAAGAGINTFFAWAKDAAGNVSLSRSGSVTITLPDTTVPVVSAFTLPATATSLTVPVSTLTATDNVGVTGYCLTETNNAASCGSWPATAPTRYSFASYGFHTLFAFARDAAGNNSTPLSSGAGVTIVHKAVSNDFDGDGKSDLVVCNPSNYNWLILGSATNTQSVVNYGTSGDITVSGDYDGDGKTDIAVWRPAEGNWYILNSADNTQRTVNYGIYGDIPVPGDYNGDGKTDIAVFRPSNGNWYILNTDGTQRGVNWGISGDIPVPGDYNGSGKTDIAVWRPSDGNWYILNSADNSQRVVKYGTSGDIPVPGDYNGDGKTDLAVWRPSDGNWYILNSADNTQRTVKYGTSGDIPVPGDYDGTGRQETAVWRPAEGNWYILNNTTNAQRIIPLGVPTDQPVK
jgi:hypothetical protein